MLFAVTAIGGALLYPQYRIDVRPALEDTQNVAANGVFEIKEHLVAIGLGLLPVYWLFWRKRNGPETAAPRRYLTWLLAFFVWWSFIVGHVLNNIRGLLLVKDSRLTIFSIMFGVHLSRRLLLRSGACSGTTRRSSQFHWLRTDDLGVVILWYGWIATAALASAAIAFAVPKSMAERLWPGWAWIIPTAVVVAMLIYERRWFV